jgi:hypothetical protein
MKRSLLLSVPIALGLVIMGESVRSGIKSFANRDRVVSVRGLAERDVEANHVTWPITYTIAGDNLPALYSQMQANNEAIIKFLTDGGINKDEISVNPPELYNAESNLYGGDRARYQYNLTPSITVSSAQVSKVRELLIRQSELLSQGLAINNGYVNYEYTALNDVKPEMIAEATHNARNAADRFAADSESKLGKIKSATQGQFSIESADGTTPHIKRLRVVTYVDFYLED